MPQGARELPAADGVQLIGPWFGERLVLAAARDIERGCGTATPIDSR